MSQNEHVDNQVNYRIGKLQVENNIPAGEFSHPWRAMPDQYKVDKSDPMYCQKSYQSYFNGEKQHIAKWTGRELPEWFKEEN